MLGYWDDDMGQDWHKGLGIRMVMWGRTSVGGCRDHREPVEIGLWHQWGLAGNVGCQVVAALTGQRHAAVSAC